MSNYPPIFSKFLKKFSKKKNVSQRELKSMSKIVYTNIVEIKQHSNQHGCKVSSGEPLKLIIASIE